MSNIALPMRRGRFRVAENVSYVLRDKDGNIKPMFVENHLGERVLKYFRSKVASPIENGVVKPGILNHLAAYGLRIPFITGRWAHGRRISNLITNAGMAGVASRINGAGGEAAFVYIAMGEGVTAASVSDTALQSEIVGDGLSRASATASRVTVDVASDGARLTNTFTVTGTHALTESGVLNAGSGGTLLCRQVFSAVNVNNGDSLQVTWTIDVD